MNKFIQIILSLHCLLSVSLATCPDKPIIASTSVTATNPLVITPASSGMSNFPSSTNQVSFLVTIQPKEACITSPTFPLFSLTLIPSGLPEEEVLGPYIKCSDFQVRRTSEILATFDDEFSNQFTSFPDILSLFVSIDLVVQKYKYEIMSSTTHFAKTTSFSTTITTHFDGTTKLYMCSQKGGASAKACTVSNLQFIYSTETYTDPAYSNLGGTSSTLTAFYPLITRDDATTSLTSSFGTAAPGYFGDKPSSPTAGTSPLWHSSNQYVQMTSGGFLTFPLPSLQAGSPVTSKSLSVAAWILISSTFGAAPYTIFSTHASDGTLVGVKLAFDAVNSLYVYSGSTKFSVTPEITATIVRGVWQLIGFDLYLRADGQAILGSIYVDGAVIRTYLIDTPLDLTTPTLLRVSGASNGFIGAVSALRIMTPGGSFANTDTCLPENSLELGTNSFALSCSGINVLNTLDSKCYASCPAEGAYLSTYTFVSLCFPCPAHCKTCDRFECNTCESGYFYFDKLCVNSCPAGMYFSFPSCDYCPTNCATCDSTQCLTCDTNYLLYNKACVDQCPLGAYETGSTCTDCPSHCETCDENQCLTCETDYFIYNKACVNSCPTTTYFTGTTCKNCPSNCKACNSVECSACDSNYLLYEKQCIASCPSKTYETSSTCIDCPSNCKTCDSKKCLTCDSNYLLYSNACVNSCPDGTYSTGSACESCPNNCATCDENQCLTCNSDYFVYKKSCINQCPTGTFFELSSCTDCPDNCDECDSSGCKACSNSYNLNKNGKCIFIEKAESGGLSGGAIAGIICGGIATIAIAVYIAYSLKRKKSSWTFRRIHPEIQSTETPNFTFTNSPPNSELVKVV